MRGSAISAGLRSPLAGCDVKRFGMGPAVMLGQDLAEVARTVGDGTVADLAAGNRKLGSGRREAVGASPWHLPLSCQVRGVILHGARAAPILCRGLLRLTR